MASDLFHVFGAERNDVESECRAAAGNPSLDLSRRCTLSHRDSMRLAACAEAGVTTLYTEDLAEGTSYGPVTAVNPFA